MGPSDKVTTAMQELDVRACSLHSSMIEHSSAFLACAEGQGRCRQHTAGGEERQVAVQRPLLRLWR